MKTTKEVGKSVSSVVFEKIFDEKEVKSDFEREEIFCTKVHFYILSERASNDRKNYQSKGSNHCWSGSFGCCEIHWWKKVIHDWQKDNKLRKSSDDQRSSQSFHFSKDLERELLDTCIHITCWIAHRKRQSSYDEWIWGICWDKIGNYNCKWVDESY